jgi:hypothetical protein
LALTIASALLASAALVACGGEDAPSPPPICSSVAALKSSVADLKNVELTQGALATLQKKLTKVQSDVSNLKDDAKSEYATEVDAVEQAAASVSTTLEAAIAAPSASTLAAVRTAVRSLGTSLTALQDAVKSTC